MRVFRSIPDATYQIRLALPADILQCDHLVGTDSLSQSVKPFPRMRIRALGVNDRSRSVMLLKPRLDALNRLLEDRLVLVVVRHNTETPESAPASHEKSRTYMS